MQLRICKISPLATIPSYATPGAAGLDLSAALSQPLIIKRGQSAAVSTGLIIALPPGYEGQVRPRSGLAAKHGVTILNAPGTIDEDYRGEVRVLLINHGAEDYTVHPNDRIAQLIVTPVERVDVQEFATSNELGGTSRGAGGFGSTGI